MAPRGGSTERRVGAWPTQRSVIPGPTLTWSRLGLGLGLGLGVQENDKTATPGVRGEKQVSVWMVNSGRCMGERDSRRIVRGGPAASAAAATRSSRATPEKAHDIRLQAPAYVVAGSATYGGRLRHLWLQASIAYGVEGAELRLGGGGRLATRVQRRAWPAGVGLNSSEQ